VRGKKDQFNAVATQSLRRIRPHSPGSPLPPAPTARPRSGPPARGVGRRAPGQGTHGGAPSPRHGHGRARGAGRHRRRRRRGGRRAGRRRRAGAGAAPPGAAVRARPRARRARRSRVGTLPRARVAAPARRADGRRKRAAVPHGVPRARRDGGVHAHAARAPVRGAQGLPPGALHNVRRRPAAVRAVLRQRPRHPRARGEPGPGARGARRLGVRAGAAVGGAGGRGGGGGRAAAGRSWRWRCRAPSWQQQAGPVARAARGWPRRLPPPQPHATSCFPLPPPPPPTPGRLRLRRPQPGLPPAHRQEGLLWRLPHGQPGPGAGHGGARGHRAARARQLQDPAVPGPGEDDRVRAHA
jgi:hypothetical protein